MPEEGVDAWVFRRAPLLGEHSAQVLNSWLGYSNDEVSKLVQAGILGQNKAI